MATVPGVFASTPGGWRSAISIGPKFLEGLQYLLDEIETDEGKHPMPRRHGNALLGTHHRCGVATGRRTTEKKNFVDLVHGGRKRGHVDGLRDVGVGLRGIGANEGSVTVRGGQHHTGNLAERRIGLDQTEKVAPGKAGQIEVQDDYIRPRCVLVGTTLKQVVPRLLPVPDDLDPVKQLAVAQGLPGEESVPGIVLDEEEIDDLGRV